MYYNTMRLERCIMLHLGSRSSSQCWDTRTEQLHQFSTTPAINPGESDQC